MIDEVDVYKNLLLKHPFTCLVAGATSSGKSTIVSELINNISSLTVPDIPIPVRVTWCLGSANDAPTVTSTHVALDVIYGRPPEEPDCDILVIDDQMTDMADSKHMCDLFSKHSHHKKMSIFFIVQNLFFQGKHMRNIALNSHYLILTKSRRDISQVKRLGIQLFGKGDFFFDAYKKAVLDREYGYLFVDLSPSTDERFRLRSHILPSEYPISIYYPK